MDACWPNSGRREELERNLHKLRHAGKANTTLLLDLEPLLDLLAELAAERLADWAEARRVELFHFGDYPGLSSSG